MGHSRMCGVVVLRTGCAAGRRARARRRNDIRMRILKNSSMVFGIVVGCLMGMAPLAYPEAQRPRGAGSRQGRARTGGWQLPPAALANARMDLESVVCHK